MGTTTDRISIGDVLADGSLIRVIEDYGHDRCLRFVDTLGRPHYWDRSTRLVNGNPREPSWAGWASD